MEHKIFSAFLESWPSLKADVVDWSQPNAEFPDVITNHRSGAQVEWELGEWLDPVQTVAAKHRERARTDIEAALGDQGANTSEHILFCLLPPHNPPVRFNPQDAERFCHEMFGLIAEVDQQWSHNPGWHSPQGHRITAFVAYPTLAKYLRAVHFEPRRVGGRRRSRPEELPWIVVEGEGGFYDPDVAVRAMIERLDVKIRQYGPFGKADVRLIVFYDEALLYNTPYRSVAHRTFGDVVQIAAQELTARPKPSFMKIYLLHAPGNEVFEIYPTFQRM